MFPVRSGRQLFWQVAGLKCRRETFYPRLPSTQYTLSLKILPCSDILDNSRALIISVDPGDYQF